MPPRFKQRFFCQRSRRDQPHHPALHHRFRTALFRLDRAFQLLADRNPKPFSDQGQQIALCRMVRHTAHRDVCAQMLSAFCQRNIQRLCRSNGIVKEQLIKIAHPIKQQCARMVGLYFKILRHHRSDSSVRNGQRVTPPENFRESNGVDRWAKGEIMRLAPAARPRKVASSGRTTNAKTTLHARGRA